MSNTLMRPCIETPSYFDRSIERKWTVRTPMGDYVVWSESSSGAKSIVWRMTRGLVEKSDMIVMLGE